ncbi:Fic family protein [Desulfobotulus sp. H1]|uniref:Fic family protein n=1 Tax=Desulfobotulus pelophilus TaxID=2823377 RepID=A0ABT3N7V3_9BACT|nr:Fic family protein [Desulfobotulus pelophilus]MCW7753531.1 Fic family protein [Desulfobotulus pelophilus]
MTYKSGKFIFQEKYDSQIIRELFIRAMVLNETIAELPVFSGLASRLEPEIMYSSIAGTAAIEGNPISEADVRKISEGHDLIDYSAKDQQEIKNLIEAYDYLSEKKIISQPFLISEQLIRNLHKIITTNVPHEYNIPGNYRNGRVEVGDKAHGGVYRPPKCLDDVSLLMAAFTEWMNSHEILELPPLIRAPLAHYYLCAIHPFWDGNGRTARLLEALILQTGKLQYIPGELSNYYYRNIDNYYSAFSKTNKLGNDATPFLEFFLDAAIFSMEKIKKIIISSIKIFALKDHYTDQNQKKEINKRHFELLTLLLDYPPDFVFCIKDLISKMPFRLLYSSISSQTARRDLAKLSEMGLLLNNNGEYSLNFRFSG